MNSRERHWADTSDGERAWKGAWLRSAESAPWQDRRLLIREVEPSGTDRPI